MVRNRTSTVRARQRMLRRGLAAFYALSGAGKLAGASWAVALFEAITGGTAAGRELRLVTGGLELTGAVLLVLPALAGAG
ncbi:MAG TPA: hypothetical protein VKA84_24155, partial [Gemmatimonadaceae bacterium]|nr:hypothetical protein [Gemmatimonadaceae bacterium]